MGEKKVKVEAVDEPVSKLPMGKEKISLYLRAPHWITNREKSAAQVKELSQRIIDVRFPRQKSAHFCYIDFNSAEDRDKAFKELQAIPKEKQIFVTQVTKDKPKLLAKRVEAVKEKRAAKQEVSNLLKSVNEQEAAHAAANRNSRLSSKVSIVNVPRTVTMNDINKEFPKAIGVSLSFPDNKKNPGKALLTFSTPSDALKNSKRSVTINGTELKLHIEVNKNAQLTKAAQRRKKNVRYFSKDEKAKPVAAVKKEKSLISEKAKTKNKNKKKTKKAAPEIKSEEIKIYN